MGLSDLAMSFMPQQVRGKRHSVYQTGVASIQTYLDGFAKGKKSLEDFNNISWDGSELVEIRQRLITSDLKSKQPVYSYM